MRTVLFIIAVALILLILGPSSSRAFEPISAEYQQNRCREYQAFVDQLDDETTRMVQNGAVPVDQVEDYVVNLALLEDFRPLTELICKQSQL